MDKTRKLKQLVRKLGVYTGSRKFKVHDKDSDYDFIIKYKTWENHLEEYLGHGISYDKFSGSGGDLARV